MGVWTRAMLLVASALCGCGVQAGVGDHVANADAVRPIKRLLLFNAMGKSFSADLPDGFNRVMLTELSKCGIEAMPFISDETMLNVQQKLAQIIAKYQPDTLMAARITSRLIGNGNAEGVLVSLSQPGAGLPATAPLNDVWKAQTSVRQGLFNFDLSDSGALLAGKVLEQMRRDGVLKQCAYRVSPETQT